MAHSYISISAVVLTRAQDLDEVAALREALVELCESKLTPGYSIVIRTESQDGVSVDE